MTRHGAVPEQSQLQVALSVDTAPAAVAINDVQVRLARELLWKFSHPMQHSSSADQVLADLLDQHAAGDVQLPDDLRREIADWLA